jgi:hypothetical protein
MKIGDKIYCKKTLMYDIQELYFYKDKIYYIEEINKSDIYITTEKNINLRFSIKQQNGDKYKLYDFFYTQQEYRKQKLLKLLKLNQTR